MSDVKPTPGHLMIEMENKEKKDPVTGMIRSHKKGKELWGKVVATGEGDWWGNSPIKVGELALLPQVGGQLISHEGKEYMIVHYSEVKASKANKDG